MYTFDQVDNLKMGEKIQFLKNYVTQYATEEKQKGNYVSDVSYFKLDNGNLCIDILVMDSTGKPSHIFRDATINQPITDQSIINQINMLQSNIDIYSKTGVNVEDLQKELAHDKQSLSNLYNGDKISLNNLEKTYQAAFAFGINPDDIELTASIPGYKQFDTAQLDNLIKEGQEMGLNKQQVMDNITVNNQDIVISQDALGSDNTNTIKGNESITSNSTFNQIIGENYDEYKILKASSGELTIIGIRNGVMTKLDNNMLQSSSSSCHSITMLQGDGSVADKGLVASFRVNAGPGSGGDQYIGLYMQGSQMRVCYARGGEDNLIGEDISGGFAHTSSIATIDEKLNPNKNNDAKSEDKTANNVSNIRYIGSETAPARDAGELIKSTADAYDIDAKELENEYDIYRKNNPNISDEDLINSLAKKIQNEQNKEEDEQTQERDVHSFDHKPPELDRRT